MHLLNRILIAAISVFIVTYVAHAQSPDLETQVVSLDPVRVNAQVEPAEISYEKLQRALEAFKRNHRLSPSSHAAYKIILTSDGADTDPSPLSLTVMDSWQVIREIPLSETNSFSISFLEYSSKKGAIVKLNRRKDLYNFSPDVHSFNVPGNARRLGDLRLECEMAWAANKDEENFILAFSLDAAGGPCKRGIGDFSITSSKTLDSAVLSYDGRRENLPEKNFHENRKSFSLRLNDASWPDDSLVELFFKSMQ